MTNNLTKNNNTQRPQDRRKHVRFPVAHNLAQIVSVDIKTAQHQSSHNKSSATHQHAEAVIYDLSAGGVAILTPANIPLGSEFDIVISLPSLKTKPIKCRVVHNSPRYDLNKIGIEFTHISSDDKAHINAIAEDYLNCEIKLTLGVKDVCFRQCRYYTLCAKDAKIHNHK